MYNMYNVYTVYIVHPKYDGCQMDTVHWTSYRTLYVRNVSTECTHAFIVASLASPNPVTPLTYDTDNATIDNNKLIS